MKRVLAAIDGHRAKHHAPALVVDEAVQAQARAWAANGDFRHSGGKYGENLAMGWWPDATEACLAAVAMWQAEVSAYDFSKPGFTMAAGHFTQQCWVSSRRVGFGVARIAAGKPWAGAWMVVANFDPPGNYTGQFPTNVLRP
jgi:uncharacterized protein YkwD